MANRMNELVLGGEGLIGSALCERLRARGAGVESRDLKSGDDLRRATAEDFARCDRVWFLAWDTGGAKYLTAADRQHDLYRNNCELAARVFDLLVRTKKPFLFVTSQLAGQPNGYGMTKLMAEHWARQIGGRIARLWNTYGWEAPDARSHVITDLVLAALRDGVIRCRTEGHERRRFIYQTDCVEALVRLFDSSLTEADIAGDRWLTIRQVAEEISRQTGTEAEFGAVLGEELIVEPTRLLPGWSPQVSLCDGVSRVLEAARAYLSTDRA